MSAPTAQPEQGSPDAAIVALVAAQAAARASFAAQAEALVAASAAGFGGWYDSAAITAWAVSLAAQVEGLQTVVARTADAYLSRVLSLMLGRPVRPLGSVDVSGLRAGVTHAGAYGRAADVYRWQQAEFDRYARDLVSDPSPAPFALVDPVAAAVERVKAVADMDVQLADRAQTAAVYGAQAEKGTLTGYRRVIHPERSKGGACGLCVAASDRLYGPYEPKPIHARCVPGDTVVAAADVSALTRRNYPGPLVVLTTASGQQLRITPNHPVLTDEGWVPADLVHVGANVFRHRVGEGVVGRRPGEQQRPTTVEQVWRAATVENGLDPATVPLASEDFHGDGTDGEVDVVATRGLLADVGDVSFSQSLRQPLFVPGHGGWGGLTSQGALDQALFWLRNAADRGVSGAGLAAALLAGHLARTQNAGSAGIALLYPSSFQSQPYDMAGDAKVVRDGQHRFSAFVPAHDLIVRQAQPDASRFDPAFAKFAGESRHAYAQLGRDLRQRLAADVEIDRVVDKRWVEGPHVVYNLHAREGWYSAGNLIVSNCECTTLPVMDHADPGSLLNAADLRRLYKEGGGTHRSGLKATRYRVDEHGELGALLTRRGVPVRTERQAKRDTSKPGRARSEAEQVATLRRLRDGMTPALAKAQQLAQDDPKKWGEYLTKLEDRIKGLDQELAA